MNNTAKLLETFRFSELLELNDLTEEDVLDFLLEQKFIHLPEQLPIDLDD